jgi:hypothetical protein
LLFNVRFRWKSTEHQFLAVTSCYTTRMDRLIGSLAVLVDVGHLGARRCRLRDSTEDYRDLHTICKTSARSPHTDPPPKYFYKALISSTHLFCIICPVIVYKYYIGLKGIPKPRLAALDNWIAT